MSACSLANKSDWEVVIATVKCLCVCQVYNNALLINADCRTKDALEYIRKEFNEFLTNLGSMAYDETDRWLDGLFTGTHHVVCHCLLHKNTTNEKWAVAVHCRSTTFLSVFFILQIENLPYLNFQSI